MNIGKTELSLLAGIMAGCAGDPVVVEPTTVAFGPFELAPGQELTDTCVSFTLHNEQPLFINSAELTTAAGVHHSNWFWVPEHVFNGPDGTWKCADRDYSEPTAGVLGGVLFAQSTQATHEVQAFPAGAVIHIPARARIIAGLHLLNPTDELRAVPLELTLRPIPEAEVTTVLAGLALQNESIALPPHRKSRFTTECDLAPQHQAVLGRPVDFKIYYALPHYHGLGTELTFEALRDGDADADTIWTTSGRIGDKLGGPLATPFDMTGHSKIRFSCTFDNPRDTTVRWGLGDQEMCIIVAYTDSQLTWGGGDLTRDPGPGVDTGAVVDYMSSACQVISAMPER